MFCDSSLYTQQTVKVITKTITKDAKFTGQKLIVKGEKSEININGWTKSFIKIEINLISKNPSAEVARNDLNVLKYNLSLDEEEIYISNYFKSEEFNNISSNLSTVYNINVPSGCAVSLTNLYGDVYLENVNSSVYINNSFGEVNIDGMKGSVTSVLNYARLLLSNSDCIFRCEAGKSDLIFENSGGKYDLSTNYGEIIFNADNTVKLLKISSIRTEIAVNTKTIEDFNYLLVTKSGNIYLPSKYRIMVIKEEDLNKFTLHSDNMKSYIEIKTTYCPITIKTEKE